MQCLGCQRVVELAAGARIGFRDDCEGCGQDLHVCMHCRHYDPGAYNECHESNAERVLDKDRANRCEYFSPGEGGGDGTGSARDSKLSDLENLFKK